MTVRLLLFSSLVLLGCGSGGGSSSGPAQPLPTPSTDVGTPSPSAVQIPTPTPLVLPAGSLDPTFGSGGIVLVDVPSTLATVRDFAIDAQDGLAILAQTIDFDRGAQRQVGVLRLNADGSPRAAFGDDGFVETAIAPKLAPCTERPCDDTPASILLLPDDRVLVSASVDSRALEPDRFRGVLVLYRADGTLDPTFGDAGLRSPSAGDLRFDSEGRIVGVTAAAGETTRRFAVMRLRADLEPDTTFGVDGIASADAPTDNTHSFYLAASRADGSVVVGGGVGLLGYRRPLISAFTSDGVLDTSFGHDGFVTEFPPDLRFAATEALIVDRAGRIVATLYDRLARYSASGCLDPEFGDDGAVPIGFNANALLGSPDDRVLIAGSIGPGAGVLARWDANGAPDASFGDGGRSVLTTIEDHQVGFLSAVRDSRGRIVVLGEIFGQPDLRLFVARYLTEESTFPP